MQQQGAQLASTRLDTLTPWPGQPLQFTAVALCWGATCAELPSGVGFRCDPACPPGQPCVNGACQSGATDGGSPGLDVGLGKDAEAILPH